MTNTSYAVVNLATGIVENVIVWNGGDEWTPPEGCIAVPNEIGAGIGWAYSEGVFTPPEPIPPTSDEVLSHNSTLLQAATQLATQQKTALTNRVSTLQDAADLEMATPAEVAELPLRQTQLLEWKRYAVYLGRVTSQEGWHMSVNWPVQPTEGMDLTVSAVAKPVQAS